MTRVDRLIRWWRESKVRPYLHHDARILDIGCGDGSLFRRFRGQFRFGIGIDPTLEHPVREHTYKLITGSFPEALSGDETFDVITLLAVLEHVPEAHQPQFARHIAERLARFGFLVITVPSPHVDVILSGLRALRLIHGMSLEQHYGFSPDRTPQIFADAGLRTVHRKRFQLGLNNLFVFKKE